MREFLSSRSYHYVLNCAAFTDVNGAETERDLATAVNAQSVKEIANFCAEKDCMLIHLSTDYVFDGYKMGPYVETDPCSPINHYGKTKLEAEEYIKASGCNYAIFRLSWVMSALGQSFISAILDKVKTEEKLCVVSDQYGAPTSNDYIARLICKYLNHSTSNQKEIYHLSCSGDVSRFDYADFIITHLRNNKYWTYKNTTKLEPVSSSIYNDGVARPLNCVLDSGKILKLLGLSPFSWEKDTEYILIKLVESEHH